MIIDQHTCSPSLLGILFCSYTRSIQLPIVVFFLLRIDTEEVYDPS